MKITLPNQTPEDVLHKLRTHLDRLGFQDVTLTVLGSNRPSRTPIDNPFAAMVIEPLAMYTVGHSA
jgi:hypothetical protein